MFIHKYKFHFVLLVIFLCTIANSNDDITKIDTKIKQISRQANKQNAFIKNTHKTLNSIYADILRAKKQRDEIQKKLDSINAKLKYAKQALLIQKRKKDNLVDNVEALRNQTRELEKKLEYSIVDGYTKSLSLEEIKEYSVDEVVNDEIYKILLEENQEAGYRLNSKYLDIKRKEIEASKHAQNLIQNIQNIQNIQKKQLALKEKQNKVLESLKNSKNEYIKKILKKKQQQQQMLKELSKLNILKSKTIEQMQKQAQLKRQKQKALLAAKKLKERLKNATPSQRAKIIKQSKQIQEQKVKQRGSSIRGVHIAKYVGVKTSAPLSRYSIIKEFGTHKDKLYNTELFEESLTISPIGPDRRVRAVLNGEIAFIKTNHNLFGNVIIIKHSNSLATVYAQLSQISSSVHKGKRVYEGDVIAISGNILKFQVLQNGKYVNPKSIFR